MKQLIWPLFMLCVVSCTKSKDEESPVITISAPTANQSFTAGQNVNITATVTDNVQLHEVHLVVTNKATGNEIVNYEQHEDLKSVEISKSFTAQAGIAYKIKVEADDHNGNGSEKEIEVRGK